MLCLSQLFCVLVCTDFFDADVCLCVLFVVARLRVRCAVLFVAFACVSAVGIVSVLLAWFLCHLLVLCMFVFFVSSYGCLLLYVSVLSLGSVTMCVPSIRGVGGSLLVLFVRVLLVLCLLRCFVRCCLCM